VKIETIQGYKESFKLSFEELYIIGVLMEKGRVQKEELYNTLCIDDKKLQFIVKRSGIIEHKEKYFLAFCELPKKARKNSIWEKVFNLSLNWENITAKKVWELVKGKKYSCYSHASDYRTGDITEDSFCNTFPNKKKIHFLVWYR
jgi:hypothetical protein